MTVKIDSKGHWLAADAAASYKRALRDHCPAGVTSAGRTRAQQAKLRADYLAGRGAFALPPGNSEHEQGQALDLPEPARTWMRKHGEAYGWVKDVNPSESWHFEYRRSHDTKRPPLKVGSRGAAVKTLQKKVGVKDDGIFGAKTKAAVVAYQRRHALKPDGIVGYLTMNSLGI